ncbi:MAG: hypothetical protein K2K80_05595 [Clostridia bacterium]|nr:hypothetical protein [Clostridia bacterium]
MEGKDSEIKSLGFDILISAVYFTALLLSFLLLNSNSVSGNTREVYVSCLVLVLPCALDGFKDVVYTFSGKKSLDIINIIISCLLAVVSVLLMVMICTEWNDECWGNIIIYGSALSFGKYAVTIIFLFVELMRKKFGKDKNNG